jgi:type IV pilus assembly protein PilB
MRGLEDDDNTDLSIEADDAPVVQLVNLMISEAIKMRASDIHVEPFEKMLRLRYRVDGVLQEMTPPPKKFQNAIISRVKILSEMDIAEKRLPQDGRFRVKFQDKVIDFRVNACPVAHGEKVVIRILDQSNLQFQLLDLGFDPGSEKVRGGNPAPWGMILITGPTGSGKSTTLYSALSTINDPGEEHHHDRGPDRISDQGHQSGRRKPRYRPDLRRGVAELPASGSRHHHGR